MMILAVTGAWRWRHDTRVLTLAASALVTILGFLFVPYDQGHGWGFRYFHSAWMTLPVLAAAALTPRRLARSEEHTSELQSQSNLVCRLLLEKKKRHRTRRAFSSSQATRRYTSGSYT